MINIVNKRFTTCEKCFVKGDKDICFSKLVNKYLCKECMHLLSLKVGELKEKFFEGCKEM